MHGISIDVIDFTVGSQEHHSLTYELGIEILQKGLNMNAYHISSFKSIMISVTIRWYLS